MVLVDDCRVFLDAAAEALNWLPQLELVGKMTSAVEVFEAVPRLAPDLILADLSMPMINGLELTRRLKSKPSAPRIVITTFHDEEEGRAGAMAAGADAFLSKHHFVNGLPAVLQELFPRD